LLTTAAAENNTLTAIRLNRQIWDEQLNSEPNLAEKGGAGSGDNSL